MMTKLLIREAVLLDGENSPKDRREEGEGEGERARDKVGIFPLHLHAGILTEVR